MTEMSLASFLQILIPLAGSTALLLWKGGRDKGESLSEIAQLKAAVSRIEKNQAELLRKELWEESLVGVKERIGRVETDVEALRKKVFNGPPR